jgi:hypothetical protein
LALCQFQRLFGGGLELRFYKFSFQAPAKKIRPKKFAERRRLLGKTSRAPQFPGKAAEGIIRKIGDGFGDVSKRPPTAIGVVGIDPISMIEHHPKFIGIERAQIGYYRDQHVLYALLAARVRGGDDR